MGRKKRRVSASTEEDPSSSGQPAADSATTGADDTESPENDKDAVATTTVIKSSSSKPIIKNESDSNKPAIKASHYAMTSHSGEIIEEDMYVSDGSEDDDDVADVVLMGSRVGLMRRGLHQPLLVQPNLRQWVRAEKVEADPVAEESKEGDAAVAEIDPTKLAAQLLAEKTRKLEEAKEQARRIESEENAGRDPCLFSKRTAFDIRFDQIDDKPWERGTGDLTDFFNYSLTVEDWLEYAQQQLTIRQELTDASRQKRPPDPNIVPCSARKPKSQTPKVAVAALGGEDGNEGSGSQSELVSVDAEDDAPVIGPEFVKEEIVKEEETDSHNQPDDEKAYREDFAGEGGVWGASTELQKLIEEQENQKEGGHAIKAEPPNGPPDGFSHGNPHDRFDPRDVTMNDNVPMMGQPPPPPPHDGGWGHRNNYQAPPPPQDMMDGGRHNDFFPSGRGGRGRGRGRGRFGGRFDPYMGRGGRGGPRSPPQQWGGRGGRGGRGRYGGGDPGYYGGGGY